MTEGWTDCTTLVRGQATEAAPAPIQSGTVGWRWVPVVAKAGRQLHLLPVNDIAAHRVCETCACKPVEDVQQPGMWSHNAWDDRERYERGCKKH